MAFKDVPIQRKLMSVMLLVNGVVLLVTCGTFFTYEFFTFRQATIQKLSTIGKIIAVNSTAALAFENGDDAKEIITALKTEPHVVSACIYDKNEKLLARYSSTTSDTIFPLKPAQEGYVFNNSYLEGFEPIILGNKQLGILYLKSDLKAMDQRFQLYGIVVVTVILVSFLLTYILSLILQKRISEPILSLATIAKTISIEHDYSVRAMKSDNSEVGTLTDAFNHMLIQIDTQNKELNKFNQNLEQMVKNRTRELEITNKELESFSYSVSHDLRAPARAISSYASIFLGDYGKLLDDEGKRLINTILKSGIKMGSLIDDLLSFSQLGRKELIKTTISMNTLVSNIWNDSYKPNEERNVELRMKELPDAYAEKSTIQQVWVNLISNALKYTKNKKETVIEIAGEKKGNETLYYIKDNGSGFDMEYYNKLFGVFQRLHSQEEFEGTGVGLAIAERIITKHGGKIWAKGKVDEGATFYFSLPAINN
ncbi:MAG TPA: ATP-binding protein [Bacteroidia bacterium]|nr:ATP-binding protein [Bacteroidia bacterium]